MDRFEGRQLAGQISGHIPLRGTQEQKYVNGVFELCDQFDVFLFSYNNTLMKDGLALPGGATLVPRLRQKGKRIGIFNCDEDLDRNHTVSVLNRAGLSFTSERVLYPVDFQKLESRFPLVNFCRVLVVCGQTENEISLAKAHNLSTLLIGEHPAHMAIDADFRAPSV